MLLEICFCFLEGLAVRGELVLDVFLLERNLRDLFFDRLDLLIVMLNAEEFLDFG